MKERKKDCTILFFAPQQAAQSLSTSQNDFFLWDQLNMFSETFVKKFCSDASQEFLADVPRGSFFACKLFMIEDS